MIYEPMVRSAQTVHLSCTDMNTVSKRIEMKFHMTYITKEFHRVHPKQFLNLWYVSLQTVHLSCVKICTISKQNATSFHLGLIP